MVLDRVEKGEIVNEFLKIPKFIADELSLVLWIKTILLLNIVLLRAATIIALFLLFLSWEVLKEVEQYNL